MKSLIRKGWVALVVLLGAILFLQDLFNDDLGLKSASKIQHASLEQEQNFQRTLQLIQQGGPFPYSRDGITFENREGRLPQKPRGYYREFTVDTPGLNHRGPRRIVSGGNPPEVFYYTEDHYTSFIRINPQ